METAAVIENREIRPELDPRYVDIFQKLGKIEGVLEEHEKHIENLTQSHVQLDKQVGASMQELKNIVHSIDKKLDIASALEKERQETRALLANERREDKKSFMSIIPIIKDVVTTVIILTGALWAIFEVLGKH